MEITISEDQNTMTVNGVVLKAVPEINPNGNMSCYGCYLYNNRKALGISAGILEDLTDCPDEVHCTRFERADKTGCIFVEEVKNENV